MNDRELGQLLMKQPTAEIFGQLAALAAAASEDGKAHLLKRALAEHGRGNVHSPVNGFVLYVLCTNLKGAPSLKLMQEHPGFVEHAVYTRWNVQLKRLYIPNADDSRVRDFANAACRKFFKLVKSA